MFLADRKVYSSEELGMHLHGIKLAAPAIVVKLLQVQICQRKIDWLSDITLELTNFSEITDYVLISPASALIGSCCQLPH